MDQNRPLIQVRIRLYAGLNRHLPRDRRGLPLAVDIAAGSSIGQMLDNLGVQEEAVHLILQNGDQSNVDSVLQQNDRIALYPAFQTLETDL